MQVMVDKSITDRAQLEDIMIVRQETRLPQTRTAMLTVSRPFTEASLVSALNLLADEGWNSVAVPLLFQGYPLSSMVTWKEYGFPQQHPGFRKWDPLAVTFDVAWRRGLEILACIAPYMAVSRDESTVSPILRKRPKWAARPHPKRKWRASEEDAESLFFCPVNEEYRRFLCDMLHEQLDEYPFYGLVLDLRRYPFYKLEDNIRVPFCFCDACREKSLADLGFDPVTVDFEKEKAMVGRWRDWQTERMDESLAYLRMRSLKARSTMRVLGLLTSDDGIAERRRQPLIHWKTWIEKSLVEALVLDSYSPDLEKFQAQLTRDVDALPRSSLLLPMLPRQVMRGEAFAEALKELPVPGLITRFEDWDSPEFNPRMRLSFKEKAFAVESDPVSSVCVLFQNMAEAAGGEEEFSAFLRDLAAILLRSDQTTVERFTMVADNLQGLHNIVLEGRLDFGDNQDQILHDLDLAYRLVYLAICDLKD